MVDSGKENGARKLTFLQDVERLQRYTETLPGCVKTHSLVDIIRRINFVLHEGRPENDVLPQSRKTVTSTSSSTRRPEAKTSIVN